MGELVINGGMESFTGSIPTDWTTTTPTLVSQQVASGRVHSGNSSVNLINGATLSQTIPDITPGCFFEFSFFANAQGNQVGVIATVTFTTTTGDVFGGAVTVRGGDIPTSTSDFAYYEIFTNAAPANVTGARIDFNVSGNGQQSLNLDDVSFG